MSRLLPLLLLLLALPLAGARKAESPPPEEVDRLALAALLLRDGHLDRADAVLAEVDPEDPDLDRARFFLLRGVVRLGSQLPREAARDFASSIEAGNAEPPVFLQLGQAWLAADEPQKAVDALLSSWETLADRPSAWALRGDAHRRLEQWDLAAWTLRTAAARFPDAPDLERQYVLLLVELGLFQEASEAGQGWLSRAGDRMDSWLVLAQAFLRSGRSEEALVLLEEARLRFPAEPAVTKQLAGAWLAAGKPLAAGNLLRVEAERDPSLFATAAECFRRAGHLPTALMLNAEVRDPSEQARQRLGLLIDSQDFERAAALGPRLTRLALLDEPSVRYGLAYASFQTGEHERADELLVGVADPAIFQMATRLREAIASCREDALGCL